jgi:protein SCO1
MLHPRVRLAVLSVATIVLVGILIFVLAADPGGGSDKPQVTSGFAGSIRPQGPPADFALRDQDGRTVRVADERGRPVIVTFMYSTCENECPTMAAQIRGALDDLGHDVPVLAVSVDPANDTPTRARRFLEKQRLNGRASFLLGDTAQLQRVWRAFGVQPQEPNGREHSASVVVLDRDGRQRAGFPVDQLTPEGLAHDVRALERSSAQGS